MDAHSNTRNTSKNFYYLLVLLFIVHKTLEISVINWGPVHDEVSIQLTTCIYTVS